MLTRPIIAFKFFLIFSCLHHVPGSGFFPYHFPKTKGNSDFSCLNCHTSCARDLVTQCLHANLLENVFRGADIDRLGLAPDLRGGLFQRPLGFAAVRLSVCFSSV
jgi:hypothetical protein